MKYIVFLSEGGPNPDLLGGKGSNLIKLVKMGANVPPGFIVTSNAYKKFVKESEYREELEKLLSGELESKNIMQYSAEIKKKMGKSKIPGDIVAEIRTAFDLIYEKVGFTLSFAVRSSATVEDTSQFSFAGQAETFLFIKSLDDILKSIKNCWISLFSPQAMLYILQMRKRGLEISLLGTSMAVVIQQMVNSNISGVLFTANVINNNVNQMLINSTWGLGETIANNLVNPDTIIINKDKFEIVKLIIGEKEKKSIQNSEGSGTILVETDAESRRICSLNESQLRQLHKLGLKIESAFRYPQDIELGIENDVIYTLQTRPITTLRK
jgi:pyruvate,water dikinase